MIEDKLEHDERLRLECVAQAVQWQMMNRGTLPSTESLLSDAATIEQYVRGNRT